MSDDAKTIIDHQEKLAAKRFNFDQWWQDIALRVMPSQAQFTVKSEQGERRTERMFDSSAANANDKFAAVLQDLITPSTSLWHGLDPEDEELKDDQAAKVYLERLNNALWTARYRPKANFESQKHQGYQGVGAFGNSCLFIDEEAPGMGPRYQNFHMREVFWAENHQGIVDTLYRRFSLQGQQAVKKWGDKLPEKIRTDAVKNPWNEWDFIHCVRPNDELIQGRPDYRGMPWSSYYVSLEGKTILDAGGYRTWPFGIGRYMLAPREVYARSPAMSCWPAILTINEEKKTILRAGQKEVDPPVLLQEDGILDGFNMQSRALNYGAVTNDGSPLAIPFKTGANIPLGLELMQLEKSDIEESFLVAIFKVLQDPDMTATQVLEIAQQKATLLAPVMGRHRSEDLGPMIEREIDILAQSSQYAWIHEQMPQTLRMSGGRYKVDYRSPLAKAMRAQEGVAILRTLQALPEAMQIDPKAGLVMDIPESIRTVAEINGVPAKLLRSKDDIEKMAQDQQQAQAAQQMAEAAPGMTQAMLNTAKTQQLTAAA